MAGVTYGPKYSLFVHSKVEDCKECTTPMDSPMQLPCGHMICDNCVAQLNNEERRKCPDCKKTWEEADDLSKVQQK